MKKVNVYDLNANVIKQIELPAVFETPLREEIIRRAVLAEETWERQPKGAYRWAGLETSADYVGRKEAYKSLKNRGQARLPREFFGDGIPGRVRRIPSSVKGRRAHPPKPEKNIYEKINKKEHLLALKSAIAATSNEELVKKRGHKIEELQMPLVVSFEKNEKVKAKDIYNFLTKLLPKEVERASKKRGKNKKYPKSALFVLSNEERNIKLAGRNIKGCDAYCLDELKVKYFAPGAHIARLTIFSENSLKELDELLKNEEFIINLRRKMMEKVIKNGFA
jgi:large subunit ribosomal protein L4e